MQHYAIDGGRSRFCPSNSSDFISRYHTLCLRDFLLFQAPKLFVPSPSTLRIQNQRNDQPIESQDLAENQNQHHPDEDSRLEHVAPHAHVAHDTDCVAGGKTGEADAEAGGQVQEAGEEGVVLAGRGSHVASDEDGDDEGVDGDDAGHYYGDERL